MVADSAVTLPGLTYDEAMALFGWTIGLATMTGGAFAVGSYPGVREHPYPSPTPSSTPDHTSRQVITAASGVPRFRSGASPADIEGVDRLAAEGQHPSCPRHHGRIGSPSLQGSGGCRRASPRRAYRDGLAPPRDHPQACNHEVLCGPASSNAAFWRALEFLRDVLKGRIHDRADWGG